MKAKAITIHAADKDDVQIASLIKEAVQELASIRKANRATDFEIRRLGASTRKKLGRIREHVRYVQATR